MLGGESEWGANGHAKLTCSAVLQPSLPSAGGGPSCRPDGAAVKEEMEPR